MQNKKLQNLFISLAVYVAMALLALVLNVLLPGDMCNPGFGYFFIILLAPLVIIGLIILSFFKLGAGNKNYLYSLFLHLAVLFGGLLLFGLLA